ncbi:MAG: hypothetical protein ABIP94_18775 [Planctomycetota bacterium]
MTAAGYQSAAFGKWGLGMFDTSGDPLQRGFVRFFGYNCQRHAHSYWPSYLWDDNKRIALDNNPPVNGGGKLHENEDPNDPASYARFRGTDYACDRIQRAALTGRLKEPEAILAREHTPSTTFPLAAIDER